MQLAIKTIKSFGTSLLREVKRVESISHRLQYNQTSFCNQWSRPLLAIRKNTGLKQFCIGFNFHFPLVSHLIDQFCDVGLSRLLNSTFSMFPNLHINSQSIKHIMQNKHLTHLSSAVQQHPYPDKHRHISGSGHTHTLCSSCLCIRQNQSRCDSVGRNLISCSFPVSASRHVSWM